MTKAEKAKAGIRCCLGPIERCDECPYQEKSPDKEFSFDECRQVLRNDALEALQKMSAQGKVWVEDPTTGKGFWDKPKGSDGP